MTRSKRNTRLTLDDIGGVIVKNNDTYLLKDNDHLNNLVISSTELKPFRKTSGHSHSGQEEVYIFVHGTGVMKIDDEMFPVKEGDTILIEDGQFHQVINDTPNMLYFVCVFDGNRSH